MEQATILDLLQIVGILLKIFALVVLGVTVVLTAGVIVYVSLQSWIPRNSQTPQRAAI
jgi:zinc transporter ZupT